MSLTDRTPAVRLKKCGHTVHEGWTRIDYVCPDCAAARERKAKMAWMRRNRRKTRVNRVFEPEPAVGFADGMQIAIVAVQGNSIDEGSVLLGRYTVRMAFPKVTGLTMQDPHGVLGASCIPGSLEKRLGLVLEEEG